MAKAIFFDIDGTLVSTTNHRISKATFSALNTLRSKGYKLFVATGRAMNQIDNLDGFIFDGYITLNGSICLNADLEIIHHTPIEQTDVDSLLSILETRKNMACVFVNGQGELTINFVDDLVKELYAKVDCAVPTVGSLREMANKPIYQIEIFMSEGAEEMEVMKHLPNCKTARWHPFFTDVTPRYGSKLVGIKAICEDLDINISDVMAFGDGGNDIEMLEGVGLGVAMGNASDAVKQHADYVTDNVDKDGVVAALKHFLLI